jgi:hypothetical protein
MELFGMKMLISSMQSQWPVQFDLSWLVLIRPVTFICFQCGNFCQINQPSNMADRIEVFPANMRMELPKPLSFQLS